MGQPPFAIAGKAFRSQLRHADRGRRAVPCRAVPFLSCITLNLDAMSTPTVSSSLPLCRHRHRPGSQRVQRQVSGKAKPPGRTNSGTRRAVAGLHAAGPRLPGVPPAQRSRLAGSGSLQPATSAQLDAAEAGPAGDSLCSRLLRGG